MVNVGPAVAVAGEKVSGVVVVLGRQLAVDAHRELGGQGTRRHRR